MSMTDPIADFLTRVRNGARAGHDTVDIPSSGLKVRIAQILEREGYIKSHRVIEDTKQGILRIYLTASDKGKVDSISGIQRISKPSRRVYVGKDEIPKVYNGLGIAILSTSKGVITDNESRQLGVGGEVLCYVW
jgi:small subunit ribosomal protein S8